MKGYVYTAEFRGVYGRVWFPRLPVEPDAAVEYLEFGVVDVALHPRLGHAVERRAGDRVPVELVGAVLLELLGDHLALARIHLAGVARVVVVDLRVRVARAVPGGGAHRQE